MSLRIRSVFVLLLMVFCLFGGMLVGAQDMGVAKIGIMVPLTGAFGADAQDVVQAAQIAVDDLNEAGGVAGYTLELVIADTVDQRADAVTTAFNQLSNTEDLNFIMTAYASTSNFEIDLMAEIDMPYSDLGQCRANARHYLRRSGSLQHGLVSRTIIRCLRDGAAGIAGSL